MVLSLAACGKKEEAPVEVKYERGDDETVYQATLGDYESLMKAAKEAADDDERFVLYAQAEAALLDSAVFLPTTTQGGAYTISRIAYRSTPYVNWGNDDDRWKGMIVSEDLITKEERADLKAMWEAAVKGEAEYDPAAYLTSKGHNLLKDYTYSFATTPVTLDSLNTSSQSDTEILVNCIDNLVEYNNLGQMIPALAKSWEVSEDGLTYTFNLRDDAYWFTSEGTQYAKVTAEDFCAGFQHMLDAEAGLEWLVDGVVKGAGDYLYNGGSWDEVGYKALDETTLQVTLEKPTSYFMTMLTYSCFNPLCKSFYESRGGVFGREAYAEASANTDTYTYGKNTDVSSQVYNGAFLLQKLVDQSEIKVVKNPGYYAPESVKLDSITWIYDAGENPTQYYNDVVKGVFAGCALSQSSGTLDMAKNDGNFDKYAYISDTTSTTYFGGLNLNRGTYALEGGTVASPKTEQQKIDTNTALNNKNFRKAVLFAFDKAAYNAVSRGEDLATTNLRNMYTHPEFVQLSKDVTDANGHTFPAGTLYGEMVQYYVDLVGAGITVADGVNGWYNPEAAKSYLEAAKSELGDSVTFPITIDVVYYSAAQVNTAQAQAVKQVIESCLGAENVTINLVEATTSEDFYASGYRATTGEAGNFDLFYGSGWGPDFGDPCTYLDTFLGNGAGYMTKVIGLF
ncbi:MAG: peptide ABC transporter substrate-binding protein [Firmicutes bacterium]|nr:peptide ABC transporter substrate-binding protein [Bacillota bacterium]